MYSTDFGVSFSVIAVVLFVLSYVMHNGLLIIAGLILPFLGVMIDVHLNRKAHRDAANIGRRAGERKIL